MWTQIFKERIKLEGIEQKEIIKIMGINESGYYKAIKNNSMKTQNILKVYKHFDWDLNELKGENKDNLKKNKFLSIETYNIDIEKIKMTYEEKIAVLNDYIKTLQENVNILLKSSQLASKLKNDINLETENSQKIIDKNTDIENSENYRGFDY